MKQRPVLRVGSSDSDSASASAVMEVKRILESHGFWKGSVGTPRFGKRLHDAVVYWQQTHIGPNGRPLKDDGVVGEKTWWSLDHPSGKSQRSFLIPKVPLGLSVERALLLNTAIGQHGVREVPNGSNRGPGVDQFLPSWCKKKDGKGPPWCCFFVSWGCKSALGNYPLGGWIGSCKKAASVAEERGLWVPRGQGKPTPGDAFVMLHRDEDGKLTGTGHIGWVVRVSADYSEFETMEGNCGNRVAAKCREVDTVEGFIKFVPDCSDFELGLAGGLSDTAESTR